MSEHIKTTLSDGVLRVTIDRAEKKNALTIPMYLALGDAMERAASDDEVRSVLLEGHAEIFTAGNDLADFMSGEAFKGDPPPVFRFIRAVVTCPKPLIAAVSGAAIGIGTTILLHFDAVYADESAYFHMPFADLGLVPEAGSSYLLPTRYGQQAAAEFLILCQKVSPARAKEIGFLTEIVTDRDVRDHAMEIATAIAAKPPIAMGYTKQLMRPDQDALLAHIEREGEIFAERAQSDEMREVVMKMMMSKANKK
ncbi:MAG: enoyl-CoA hydratase-related protein [Parvularcula sp.]